VGSLFEGNFSARESIDTLTKRISFSEAKICSCLETITSASATLSSGQ
jgi:hypothetical protein